MKNKVIKGALLSCVISLLFACNTKKAVPLTIEEKEQIKKEIQSKENEFASVYNAREIKNIGYYAEDAISYSQNKAPLVGKKAIVEYLTANIDSIPKNNQISFTTNEVFVTDEGKQVVEIGYYKVVDSVNTVVNSGNYMSIFEKREGKYVCVRDMSTSDIPLE
jgi:ketosteroid isomerase-like protein